ncbi:hypothetical protein KEM56_006007 [Ascosphaera pollenicola]|nr:hypothetical protein KEM56_006007 [Ascosphaera pollenicola]
MASLLNSAIGYASWAFIPQFITGFAQSIYYDYRPSKSPAPAEGSPEYARDRRRIYILVVTSYLLWTIWSTYAGIQSERDFYRLLGVTPMSSEKEIRSKYRRLATMFHPDKVRSSEPPVTPLGNQSIKEEVYMTIKLAYETISEPTQRFIYDRFGVAIPPNEKYPGSMRLQKFMTGALLTGIVPDRLFTFGMLVLLNLIWFPAWGRYWRFYSFFATLTCELILLTRSGTTFVPAAYLPPWITSLFGLQDTYLLPFQTLKLLHQASVAISLFIFNIAPPPPPKKPSDKLLPPALDAHIVRLLALVRDTCKEATRVNEALEAPYYHLGEDEPRTVGEFHKGMKKALIDHEIKSEPELMAAVQRAVEKRVEEKRMERARARLARKYEEEEKMGGKVARLFGVRFFDRLMKEVQFREEADVTMRSMRGKAGSSEPRESSESLDGESDEEDFDSDFDSEEEDDDDDDDDELKEE